MYGNKLLGDLSDVMIKVTSVAANATGLDPFSAPGVSVASAAAGVYVLNIPKAVVGFVDGVTGVNTAAKTFSAITLDVAAGTFGFTISGGANLATTEQVHIGLMLGAP
jgi:hypothetical protein